MCSVHICSCSIADLYMYTCVFLALRDSYSLLNAAMGFFANFACLYFTKTASFRRSNLFSVTLWQFCNLLFAVLHMDEHGFESQVQTDYSCAAICTVHVHTFIIQVLHQR